MYKIALPLLGFEEIEKIDFKIIDDNFASLILNKREGITFTVVNISFLQHAAFDFNIDDKTLELMNITNREDFDIFFCIVLQDPIEKSIVNLVAPILINKNSKLIGQFVIRDIIPNIFTNLLEK